jgi:hypothetical protein
MLFADPRGAGMLTLFSIPKAFTGHIGIIQRNAIRSWKMLHPEIEIILFGSDEGTAEVVRECGIRHEPNVERNEFGTILVNAAFAKAQAMARHEVVCYVNGDIILLEDFRLAVERVKAAHREFLMVGRRWDVEITEALPFEQPEWERELRDFVSRRGKQRGADWIDYFAFSRGFYGADMPAFAIGRTCWDNWLVWKALDGKKAVVDVSPVVVAVHQNHDYSHHPQGESGAWHGEEAGRNARLAGGWSHLRTVSDASVAAGADGLRNNRGRYWMRSKRWFVETPARFVRFRVWNPIWFAVLDVSRPLRSAVGLRARAAAKERR